MANSPAGGRDGQLGHTGTDGTGPADSDCAGISANAATALASGVTEPGTQDNLRWLHQDSLAASTTTSNPRDSVGSTRSERVEGIGSEVLTANKSVECSEAGQVELSGVQDHADTAQIVGGESDLARELRRDVTFWHQAHDGAEARREDSEKKATALREERDRLRKALERLPLNDFDKDMSEIDASEFVDHAGEFIAAMVLARAALSPDSQDGKKGGE